MDTNIETLEQSNESQMNMVETIRVFGPEVGINSLIVNADVNGITSSGDTIFTPHNGDYNDFSLSSESVCGLMKSGLAYDHNEIGNDGGVWDAIRDIEDYYEPNSNSGIHYSQAARRLFKGGP